MPAETKTATIPKIRTYADDLERVRSTREDHKPKKDERKIKKPIAPMPTAVSPTARAKADHNDIPPPPPPIKKAPAAQAQAPKAHKNQNHTKESDLVPPPSPAVKDDGAKVTITEIPSFHQFKERGKKQRQIPKITADDLDKIKSPSKESLLSDNQRAIDLDSDEIEYSSGTVITDTQHKRFRFFPAIFSSAKDWFGNLKKRLVDDRKPVYTVSETSNKNRVVRSVAGKTGRHDVVDHRVVVDRLKDFKDKSAPTDTGDEKEVHPEWRHLTNSEGEDVPLLEEADETPVPPVPVKPPPTPETTPAPPPELTATPEPELKPEPTQKPEPVPEREPKTITPTTPTVTIDDIEVETEAAAPEARAKSRGQLIPEKAPWLQSVEDTNTLSLGIVAGLAVIVCLVVGGQLVYQQFFANQSVAVAPLPEPVIKDVSETSVSITPEMTSSLFVASIRSAVSSADASVVTIKITGVPVSPPKLFTLLGLKPEPALIRTTQQLIIGGHNSTHPFLVLEVANRDTALASMLAWESSLHADVAHLFGSGLLEVTIEDRVSGFADETVAGTDVRVLYDTTNLERIVYGFHDNVLIVTPNFETFTSIVERVK